MYKSVQERLLPLCNVSVGAFQMMFIFKISQPAPFKLPIPMMLGHQLHAQNRRNSRQGGGQYARRPRRITSEDYSEKECLGSEAKYRNLPHEQIVLLHLCSHHIVDRCRIRGGYLFRSLRESISSTGPVPKSRPRNHLATLLDNSIRIIKQAAVSLLYVNLHTCRARVVTSRLLIDARTRQMVYA